MIRNTVWDHLHGFSQRTEVRDVDVAYFDPTNLERERDKKMEAALERLLPSVPWEVTNQAGVHLWYPEKFGEEIAPVVSIEDAVGRWPETVTAIGVRLEDDDGLSVVAPYGLGDLFNMVLRRNPKQVSIAYFRKRARDKRVLERWPKVTIVDD